MKRIPNLETAKDYCKSLNVPFEYYFNKGHIKFFIGKKWIMICQNKENPDRVRNDIKKVVSAVGLVKRA